MVQPVLLDGMVMRLYAGRVTRGSVKGYHTCLWECGQSAEANSQGEAFTVEAPGCASCSSGAGQLSHHQKCHKESVVLLRYARPYHVTMVIKPLLQ